MEKILIDKWISAIVQEDGHNLSSGSLKTLKMIRDEIQMGATPSNVEGKEDAPKIYKSQYPAEITYTSDKNFDVRLKVLIDKALSAIGYKLPPEFFEQFGDAEDYLFASRSQSPSSSTSTSLPEGVIEEGKEDKPSNSLTDMANKEAILNQQPVWKFPTTDDEEFFRRPQVLKAMDTYSSELRKEVENKDRFIENLKTDIGILYDEQYQLQSLLTQKDAEIKQFKVSLEMAQLGWNGTIDKKEDFENQAKALSAIKKGLESSLSDAMQECERLAGLVDFWQKKYYEVHPPHQNPKIDNL